MRGKLLCASDAGYHTARALWNAMCDKQPALIVRCAGVTLGGRFGWLMRKHGLALDNLVSSERLVTLKNTYDPMNLFCCNQNIKPTV